MELEGERRIPLPRPTVWAALNDPDVLRAAIPGCKSLEKTGDAGFTARVTTKIGPVSAAFYGTVELSDIVEGESYVISGSGQGGVAGFAKGGARVALADAEGDGGAAATLLTYKATAEIGGKLASVGSRLIEGAARKTADQFFDSFVARLGGADGFDAVGGASDASPARELAAAGAAAGGTPHDIASPGLRPTAVAASIAASGPTPGATFAPGTLRIEVGEIRITHQLSPMAIIAALGWLVAIAALVFRGAH